MYFHLNKFTVLNDLCAECNLTACFCADRQNAASGNNDLSDCDVSNIRELNLSFEQAKHDECNLYNGDSILLTIDEYTSESSNDLNDAIICNDTMRPSFAVSMHANINDSSYASSLESNPNTSECDEVSVSLHDQLSASQNQSIQQSRNDTANSQTEGISQVDLGFKCKGFRIGHINV